MEADSMGPLHPPEQQETFRGSFTVKEETEPRHDPRIGIGRSRSNLGFGGTIPGWSLPVGLGCSD